VHGWPADLLIGDFIESRAGSQPGFFHSQLASSFSGKRANGKSLASLSAIEVNVTFLPLPMCFSRMRSDRDIFNIIG
jgi:hypothetical protein